MLCPVLVYKKNSVNIVLRVEMDLNVGFVFNSYEKKKKADLNSTAS